MKNTTKHLALICGIFACALLYSEHCTAEENVLYTPRDYSIVPPAPTVGQFFKYKDYPVDYFHGVPEISFPLYTLKYGSIEVPITLSYHGGRQYWHLTNRQGSVMALLDSDGNTHRRSAHYPSGTPFVLDGDDTAVPDAGLPDDRHHIGNRWVSFGGLDWYDNTARMHDPLLMRFTTPDPLARDLTHLSPWSHCAANPANNIDPDGKIFIFPNITNDDKETITSILVNSSNNSIIVSFCQDKLLTAPYPTKKTNNSTEKANIVGGVILEVTNKPSCTIINISNNSDVIIGDADSHTIDLKDMVALGAEGPANSIGALLHEMKEQQIIQKSTTKEMNSDDYNKLKANAHNIATHWEGYINNVLINWIRPMKDGQITFEYNPDPAIRQNENTVFPQRIIIYYNDNNNIINKQSVR